MPKTMNIVIGGEAGQGLVTVGRLLSQALVRSGYSIVVTQSYQSRIRGGHNTFTVRVSTEAIEAPAEAIDLLVALNDETVALHRAELAPGGLIVADASFGTCVGECLGVPYGELAPAKFENTVALGLVGALLGLDEDALAAVADEAFGKKHPESAEGNRLAIGKAFAWARARKEFARPLPAAVAAGANIAAGANGVAGARRLMLDGNEALALGAISAGLRFLAFYPMTPATSIPLTIIDLAERLGVVAEQAEDEIAAINMAIGASYAGVPSMVATSGGGFALMVEGVSLAGMTETPIVIALGQRPAPATGLPTRTEQADLEFVLHAGHGEFPRAIYAPGSIEECFHLARRAFETAEQWQGPVFILTDQFLADSYRAVEPFKVDGLGAVHPGADPASVEAPYLRHQITENGASPRLLPGASRRLVVTDSDEHTEDGHLTEDLAVRKLMVEKRLKKLAGIRREVLPPEYEGPDRPELLLVSWGSTIGSVREAAATLSAGGRKIATLHFKQVWPLVPEHFIGHLRNAKRVVLVEGNATGQLARLIRREAGFDAADRISRYDGLPITPEYILANLGGASAALKDGAPARRRRSRTTSRKAGE